MIVLGIDASFTRTGLAVVETDGVPGRERVIWTGTVGTDAADPDAVRIALIAERCAEIAAAFKAQSAGVEMPFVRAAYGYDTGQRLARLGGAIDGALVGIGLTPVPVTTGQVAKALGIGGVKREHKKQAAVEAVLTRWGVNVGHDEADAIGVAVATGRAQRRKANKGAQLGLPGVNAGRKSKRGRR